jgi:molybdate transport system substrate-binding protein
MPAVTDGPSDLRPILRGISSMATKRLLAELGSVYGRASGVAVEFESVGGVEVPRRLQAGESFDLVVLASGAMAALAHEAAVRCGTQRAFAVSPAAFAVGTRTVAPAIDTFDNLVRALRRARSIGYSTGPSGDALIGLLERAGILAEVRQRLVQAPPGVPVSRLIGEGKAEIGFQQLSELAGSDGVTVLESLPEGASLETTFSAAVCARSRQEASAQAFIDFLASPAAVAAIREAHMRPILEPDPIEGGTS